MRTRTLASFSLALLTLGLNLVTGCKKDAPAVERFEPVVTRPGSPIVRCETSVYYTWSMDMAAHDFGDYDEREGWMGKYEIEEGVDVAMGRAEYLDTINHYGTGIADCVYLTNTDAHAAASGRRKAVGDASVAVFATSKSVGADKLLVHKSVESWNALYGIPINLAEGSVTQFLVWLGCQQAGDRCDYGKLVFVNVDPAKFAPTAASSISVMTFGGWSPETFSVMAGRPDLSDFFNSSRLPEHAIVDMLLFGERALSRKGGSAAARVLIKSQEAMMRRLASNNEELRLATLRAFSKRFGGQPPEVIKRAGTLTIAFTNEESRAVLTSPSIRENDRHVAEFSQKHGLVAVPINVGWGSKAIAPDADLRFDPYAAEHSEETD